MKSQSSAKRLIRRLLKKEPLTAWLTFSSREDCSDYDLEFFNKVVENMKPVKKSKFRRKKEKSVDGYYQLQIRWAYKERRFEDCSTLASAYYHNFRIAIPCTDGYFSIPHNSSCGLVLSLREFGQTHTKEETKIKAQTAFKFKNLGGK